MDYLTKPRFLQTKERGFLLQISRSKVLCRFVSHKIMEKDLK
jgi:hypothetical protein